MNVGGGENLRRSYVPHISERSDFKFLTAAVVAEEFGLSHLKREHLPSYIAQMRNCSRGKQDNDINLIHLSF